MAKSYIMSVTDGSCTEAIATGSYNVAANISGYDNTTINPANLNITEDVTTYDLTIAATGTLTLHVTEEGIEDGTPVVGATFLRCDSSGNTYGDPIVSDDSGNAVFNYVPFSDAGDAPVVYYKQTESDGDHDFDLELANTTLTADATTLEIFNPPASAKTLNITDANYIGLPIEQGEITLSQLDWYLEKN